MDNLSGRTTLHKHKFNNWMENPIVDEDNKGVKKVWMLDAQWSTCPIEVEDQIKDLWRLWENGNDKYVIKTTIKDLIEDEELKTLVEKWDNDIGNWVEIELKTDLVVSYLRENGVGDNETVLIHWWW